MNLIHTACSEEHPFFLFTLKGNSFFFLFLFLRGTSVLWLVCNSNLNYFLYSRVRVCVRACVCVCSLCSSKGTCESAGSLGKANLAVVHNSKLITTEELWSVGRTALRRVLFHVRQAIAWCHHRTYPLVFKFNLLLSRDEG